MSNHHHLIFDADTGETRREPFTDTEEAQMDADVARWQASQTAASDREAAIDRLKVALADDTLDIAGIRELLRLTLA